MANDNTSRLDELFKDSKVEFNVLQEALAEVSREDMEARKGKAKELIRTAMNLKSQMGEAKKKFESETKKFDKELGKVLNRLQNMASGRPLDEGAKEEEEKSSDE